MNRKVLFSRVWFAGSERRAADLENLQDKSSPEVRRGVGEDPANPVGGDQPGRGEVQEEGQGDLGHKQP